MSERVSGGLTPCRQLRPSSRRDVTEGGTLRVGLVPVT